MEMNKKCKKKDLSCVQWIVVLCPEPIHDSACAIKWKMSVVSLCYSRLITVCHAKMAAEYGNFHNRSLDGLITQQSAESAQFLIESCNIKDKTTNLSFKIHRDSFGYRVGTGRNSSNAWDNVRHAMFPAFLFVCN